MQQPVDPRVVVHQPDPAPVLLGPDQGGTQLTQRTEVHEGDLGQIDDHSRYVPRRFGADQAQLRPAGRPDAARHRQPPEAAAEGGGVGQVEFAARPDDSTLLFMDSRVDGVLHVCGSSAVGLRGYHDRAGGAGIRTVRLRK